MNGAPSRPVGDSTNEDARAPVEPAPVKPMASLKTAAMEPAAADPGAPPRGTAGPPAAPAVVPAARTSPGSFDGDGGANQKQPSRHKRPHNLLHGQSPFCRARAMVRVSTIPCDPRMAATPSRSLSPLGAGARHTTSGRGRESGSHDHWSLLYFLLTGRGSSFHVPAHAGCRPCGGAHGTRYRLFERFPTAIGAKAAFIGPFSHRRFPRCGSAEPRRIRHGPGPP